MAGRSAELQVRLTNDTEKNGLKTLATLYTFTLLACIIYTWLKRFIFRSLPLRAEAEQRTNTCRLQVPSSYTRAPKASDNCRLQAMITDMLERFQQVPLKGFNRVTRVPWGCIT